MKDRNKEHLSLSEITCVCRSAGDKTLAIHTPARSFLLMPLLLKFAGDHDLEEWQADITAGKPQFNNLEWIITRVNNHSFI